MPLPRRPSLPAPPQPVIPAPIPRPAGIPGSAKPMIVTPSGGILAGPSVMPAQRALNKRNQRREDWPYTHVYPPSQAVRVEPEGILAAPAVGVQTVVLSYQVPDAFQFAFVSLIQLYAGSGFTLGSTDITWILDVNTPIPTPAGGSAQGYPIQALSPSNIPKGALSFSASGPQSVYDPWPLPMAEILGPLDILRSKVTTTAAITPGSPNFFITIFIGWMWEATP